MRTIKVGDLVRTTETASPSEWRGKLAVVTEIRESTFLFPYKVRFLCDGEECPMSRSEIELPKETQDANQPHSS